MFWMSYSLLIMFDETARNTSGKYCVITWDGIIWLRIMTSGRLLWQRHFSFRYYERAARRPVFACQQLHGVCWLLRVYCEGRPEETRDSHCPTGLSNRCVKYDYCGIWRRVVCCIGTNVSEESAASTLKIICPVDLFETSVFTRLNGVTYPKIAVRNSNPTQGLFQ